MKSKPKRLVVIGASSSIAEHCLRIWAKSNPEEIVLVGRNVETLEPIAVDLRVRSKAEVSCHALDMVNPEEISEFVDKISEHKSVDLAFIAHGVLCEQEQCQSNLTYNHDSLNVNGLSPVMFAEAFAASMEKYNHGHIVVIGSVAGDRGRKSNYVYGAAKGLVDLYIQGMQHRFAKTNVQLTLVKPGPTDTPMTKHLKTEGVSLASVEDVAQCIVRNIDKNKFVIYVPVKWRLIMLIIRHLPRFIFNKLDI